MFKKIKPISELESKYPFPKLDEISYKKKNTPLINKLPKPINPSPKPSFSPKKTKI
jgi:hypothetical protein